MKVFLLALALMLCAGPAASQTLAPKWTVDSQRSQITFVAKNAGHEFNGKFKNWTADIRFSPKKLPASSVKVTIDMDSVSTGNNTYDGTLPSEVWFDTKTFPQAVFSSSKIKSTSTSTGMENSYEAVGNLRLRGVIQPVTLPFTVTIKGRDAVMEGETTLQRLSFGVGKGSDPKGEWVANDVKVLVKVYAKKLD